MLIGLGEIAYQAAYLPLEWSRNRAREISVEKAHFISPTLMEAEGRASKWLLLMPLAALTDPLTALFLMLPYSFLVTGVYEWLRSREKIGDLMVLEDTAIQEGKISFFARVVKVFRVYSLGLPQVLFARFVQPRALSPQRPGFVKVPVIFFAAALCGGVYATHHYIRQSGYGGWSAVVGNMACRVTSLPLKLVEITFTLTAFSLVIMAVKYSLGESFGLIA